MLRVVVAGVLLATGVSAWAQKTPPLPYESWGVCPFECCTYREWTARADIPVHQGRSEQSPVLFHLRPDEKLDAVTGVVVTKRAATVIIDKAVRDGYVNGDEHPRLSFRSGDRVYALAPLGEGTYLFWYQGKVYRSGLDLGALTLAAGKELRMTWWKQVKNKAGKIGWTASEHFSNADACG